jgi:hypothetical protein
MTQLEAERYADSIDGYGQFVCVNVKSIQDYDKAVEICSHEVFHRGFSERFAQACENKESNCSEILEQLEGKR